MKHTYQITNQDVEQIRALVNAAAPLIKGTAEFTEIVQVSTESPQLAAILDQVLPRQASDNAAAKPGEKQQLTINPKKLKMWTIVDTGEKLTEEDLNRRLLECSLPVGAALDHARRGAYRVHENGLGNLVKRQVME